MLSRIVTKLMTNENYLDKFERVKAREREQLRSGGRLVPTLNDFWTQPHGVRMLFVYGDVVERVPSVVHDRGMRIVHQQAGRMTAFPAHAGTLLSRRRRGEWSIMMATWFSGGWTKVQETTGGTVSTDQEQISHIAAVFGETTIGVMYDDLEEIVALIAAGRDAAIVSHTIITPGLTKPRGVLWNAEIVAESQPSGLSKALRSFDIEIAAHVAFAQQMVTIRNTYDVAK